MLLKCSIILCKDIVSSNTKSVFTENFNQYNTVSNFSQSQKRSFKVWILGALLVFLVIIIGKVCLYFKKTIVHTKEPSVHTEILLQNFLYAEKMFSQKIVFSKNS